MNAEEAYEKYQDELFKLRSIASKKDFSEAGDAEFYAQRQVVSAALDNYLTAYREEMRREDR